MDGGVAEGRVEQVVEARAGGWGRRLRLLEQRFERFLLRETVDQRARRDQVLCLDRAPQRQLAGRGLRADRARRPGS